MRAVPDIARADAAPCALQQIASLSTEREADGRLLVPVTLDGHVMPLMLDTGSAITSSLFPAAIETLGLHTFGMLERFVLVDGHQIDRFVVVKSLSLGPLHVESTQFLALPTMTHLKSAAAGLLGPDILRQFDLELDPADSRLNLFSRNHCPGRVVYWTRDYADLPVKIPYSGHVRVQMMLDGKPVEALIDTGSSQTYVSLTTAHRLFDLDVDSANMAPVEREDPSEPRQFHYRFSTLAMAGIAINHPNITILEDKMQRKLDKADFATPQLRGDEVAALPDLTLGMNILSKLRLYIAYGESHIYVSAAGSK